MISWTEGLAEYFDFEKGNYARVFRKTNPVIDGEELYYSDGFHGIGIRNSDDPELYEQVIEKITKSRESHIEVNLKNFDQLGRILSFESCHTTRWCYHCRKSRLC